jgi:hypothetical protein
VIFDAKTPVPPARTRAAAPQRRPVVVQHLHVHRDAAKETHYLPEEEPTLPARLAGNLRSKPRFRRMPDGKLHV